MAQITDFVTGFSGTLGMALNGETNNVFKVDAIYDVHVFTDNRYMYLGNFTHGKSHGNIDFTNVAKYSRYVNLIAVEKK